MTQTDPTTYNTLRLPDAADIEAIRSAIDCFAHLPVEEANELMAAGLRTRLIPEGTGLDAEDTSIDTVPSNEGLCLFNIPAELGNGNLRTVTIDSQIWFVAADFAEVLGYGHVPSMMRMIDDDEKGVHKVHTLGGQQLCIIVSQSGLFTLILKSQRDEAVPFRRWVTGEVLPTIARTGGYSDDADQMGEHLGQAMAGKLGLDEPTAQGVHKPHTPATSSAILALLLPLLLPLLPALLAAVTGWLNRQGSNTAKALQPEYMAEAWFIILQAVCTEHPRVDVARRLGVSAPFLSQVLNGSGKYGRGEASTHKLAERTLRCFANLNPTMRSPNRPAGQAGKTTVTVEH